MTDNRSWASRAYGPLRRSVHRFVRTGGQIGGLKPVSSVPERILKHWLHPASYDAKTRLRVGYYLANSRSWEDPRDSYAGRVFRNAMAVLDDAAKQRPFALIVNYATRAVARRRSPEEYGDPRLARPEPGRLR